MGGVVGRVAAGNRVGSRVAVHLRSRRGPRRCPPVPPLPRTAWPGGSRRGRAYRSIRSSVIVAGDGNAAVSVHPPTTTAVRRSPRFGVSCTSTDFGVAATRRARPRRSWSSVLTNNASYTCTATVTERRRDRASAPSPPWGPFVDSVRAIVRRDQWHRHHQPARRAERLLRGGDRNAGTTSSLASAAIAAGRHLHVDRARRPRLRGALRRLHRRRRLPPAVVRRRSRHAATTTRRRTARRGARRQRRNDDRHRRCVVARRARDRHRHRHRRPTPRARLRRRAWRNFDQYAIREHRGPTGPTTCSRRRARSSSRSTTVRDPTSSRSSGITSACRPTRHRSRSPPARPRQASTPR